MLNILYSSPKAEVLSIFYIHGVLRHDLERTQKAQALGNLSLACGALKDGG